MARVDSRLTQGGRAMATTALATTRRRR
jgi:hypothetical protein